MSKSDRDFIKFLILVVFIFSFAIWFARDTDNSDGPAPDPYNMPVAKSETETNDAITPYFVEAFDGSQVLVAPYPLQKYSGSSYIFFRDRDNDGYADTKGKGFYMFDLSKKIEEKNLPQKKYKMEDLYKDPWNVHEVSSLW